jgi:signal peptidase I
MHPSIKNEDIITVVPIAPSGVKVGDVILYRTAQNVIAHRVVRIKKNKGTPHFILRADALGASKEQVAASQVLGKVVFVERSGAGVDIYCIKTKVFRLGYNFILRLKRWMV